MPQYWLKPLGVTDPPSPMDNDWASGVDLDNYRFMTGPATPRQPPQMGGGDHVLFHAVIHGRLFADVTLLASPDWQLDPEWGDRWPWVYPCRVVNYVPLIADAITTADAVPKRAMNRIRAGGDFAKLSPEEYGAARDALLACPAVVERGNSA